MLISAIDVSVTFNKFILLNHRMQRNSAPKKSVSIMVLYNYKPNLINIVDSIKSGDLDFAIFVDNSITQANVIEFVDISHDPSIGNKIIYIKNKTNLGLSKALNFGLEEAKKLKTDYVFILDQDADITKDYFRVMRNEFQHINKLNSDLYLLGPIVSNCRVDLGKKLGIRREFSSVKTLINSGMLFEYHIIDKGGKFNEDLFLGSIDHDFCKRILDIGGKIYRFNKVMIYQDFGHTIKNPNFIGKILELGIRMTSYIMIGLNKTNEFTHFISYYSYSQYKLNLRDSIKFQRTQKLNFFKLIPSKINRLIIEKFGVAE